MKLYDMKVFLTMLLGLAALMDLAELAAILASHL
jgi:hypothetical protein